MFEVSDVDVRQALDDKESGWLYMSSPFCATCQHAERLLQIIEASTASFICQKLNIQLAPDIAQSLQIESVPAMLYYKDGEKRAVFYSFSSIVAVLEKMKEVEKNVNGL